MIKMRELWILPLVLFGISAAVMAEERGSFDRTLKVSGAVDLSVQSGSGAIRVHAGAPGTVSVHGEIRARWADAAEKVRRLQQNPPIEQTGNRIQIGRIPDEDLTRNVSISYDVTVPADTRLDARAGSGGIEVTALKGAVTAHTGSGGIRLEDIGGSLSAHTGSGGIRGTAIGVAQGGASARIEVSTGSGGITLEQVRGSLDAHAGSGHISISGEPTGNWELRGGSGGVDLQLPAKAAFELRARAGSGGIRVDYPITMQGSLGDRHHVEGKVGSGGPMIDVQTGSGGIHVHAGGSQAL